MRRWVPGNGKPTQNSGHLSRGRHEAMKVDGERYAENHFALRQRKLLKDTASRTIDEGVRHGDRIPLESKTRRIVESMSGSGKCNFRRPSSNVVSLLRQGEENRARRLPFIRTPVDRSGRTLQSARSTHGSLAGGERRN